MTWSCPGADTGSFAGQALGDSCEFFTSDDASQGSELGFWLWVSSEWPGPAVTLASFQSGTSGEPAWALVVTADSELHLTYAESFSATWNFIADLGAVPNDCWCWISLSAAYGAFRWSVWTQDGTITTGHAAMPGPAGAYSITGTGQLALGYDLTGLANTTWGNGTQAMEVDGGLKISKLLYVELALSGNQTDPMTSESLVQTLPGEASASFLKPRLNDWPVMSAARGGNFSGALGAFTGFFVAAAQGDGFFTTGPHDGFVFANGPSAPLPDLVRLVHNGGLVDWQHDSMTFRVNSVGTPVLQTPFPTMTPPAARVLGQDAATGLPMWVDPPAVSTSVPVTPVPVPSPVPPVVPPAVGDPCIQTRCGAAVALQTKLVNDYDNWRQWINAAVSVALGGLIAAVIAEIAAILAAAEVAAWVLQVFKIVTPIIGSATLTSLPTLIPVLTAPQTDRILQEFFCAVDCTGGEVAFTQGEQQAVSAAILANSTTFPSDLMRELLGEIVYYDPNQDWQAVISNAPISGLCDGMTCP